MWFAVISIFPEMVRAIEQEGIVGKAIQQKQVTVHYFNPRDFTEDKHRRVDERTFGGGPGMVMMAEPLAAAIRAAKTQALQQGKQRILTVLMSPQGCVWDEHAVQQYSVQYDAIILIAGRYEGVDQRVIDRYVDVEVSIGDYVLSGGELACMVLMDTLIRRVDGVMNDPASHAQDSFADGWLDCPHYTKPDVFEGIEVPEVLKSGHHAHIAAWRFKEKFIKTQRVRPDLLHTTVLTKEQKKWLRQFHIEIDEK